MNRASKSKLVLSFKVLEYKEDGEYVAHALEADLLGCGASPAAAIKELKEALDAQISFAMHKGDLGLITHPAPQEFFDRWEAAHKELLIQSFFAGDHAESKNRVEPLATMFGFSCEDLEKIGAQPLEFARA